MTHLSILLDRVKRSIGNFFRPWFSIKLISLGLFLTNAMRLSSAEPPPLQFLENEYLRVGIQQDSGGAIAWVSKAGSDQNLIDHYDRGRLVQQSYYGDEDGSLWDRRPWRWNAVQGGGWRGESARVLVHNISADSMYFKTHPKHWATGEDLTDAVMEQKLVLKDRIMHAHYRFEYSGTQVHKPHHQEVPAIFLPPQYDKLITYSGDRPWSEDKIQESQPGNSNEYHQITEHWAAYVNEQNIGLGAYVPKADRLTCYRFRDPTSDISACSYMAPIVTFGLKPGLVWEYDLYIAVGSAEEIRAQFKTLHNQLTQQQ